MKVKYKERKEEVHFALVQRIRMLMQYKASSGGWCLFEEEEKVVEKRKRQDVEEFLERAEGGQNIGSSDHTFIRHEED